MDSDRLRETAALVALLRYDTGTPWPQVAMEVEEEGSAIGVLARHVPEGRDRSGQVSMFEEGTEFEAADLEPIEAEVREWIDDGMQILTVLDSGYPDRLRTVHEMPPLLFVRGELVEQDTRTVAVVGSRRASEEGLQKAAKLAGELVERGYTVASGLAKGIDTAAHRGAIAAGGRTIGVIGTGLRRSYPKESTELQRELGETTAIISQFWPDQPPTKWTFPKRNAVMSGLSLASVVVEAHGNSGAMMQARLALEHGRPVFLSSELVETNKQARAYAERPGAHVVDSADQIAQRMDSLLSVDALTG
jgi:DNA processing protein